MDNFPVQGAGPGSGPAERPPGAFPVLGTGPGSGPIERPPGAFPCDTGPGGGPAERPPGVALSRAVQRGDAACCMTVRS